MPDRLLTPSKITAWLDCEHYLALIDQVESGLRPKPKSPFGSFARLLADKGLLHERECLEHFRRQGKSILEMPDKQEHESFVGWVKRTGNPLDGDHDVIYQMPFIHDDIRGVADFLVRVEDPETSAVSYEPVDAKLARAEAKPGHVLQLCFYADAIEALTGARPKHIHLWLGSGRVETLRVLDFDAYWRRLRGRLRDALAVSPVDSTEAVPCAHCPFCEFSPTCEAQWRDADALHYVAGIRKPELAAFAAAGTDTLTALSERVDPVDGIRAERMLRLRGQAALQVQAAPELPPPFSLVEVNADDTWGRGWEKLPEPDDGDVFLDFEGHPFWRPDAGLFFLFGLLEREP